jgi:hypothetical protein
VTAYDELCAWVMDQPRAWRRRLECSPNVYWMLQRQFGSSVLSNPLPCVSSIDVHVKFDYPPGTWLLFEDGVVIQSGVVTDGGESDQD